MGQLTSDAKKLMLDAIFGSGAPTNIIVCLMTGPLPAFPTGADVDALAPSYTGYAHKSVTNNDTNFPDADEVDEAAKTSGSLVIGARYLITDFNTGDNFTNVGGTNATGASFIATGTTPTTWSNGSTLYRLTVRKTTGAEIAFDECTVGSAAITHFAFKDTASGGNVLGWGALTTSKTIDVGDTPRFPAGALTIDEN